MILSYIFGDKITKMDIAPDVISFGSYRVSVRHLASVSSPRNLEIWNALEAHAMPINFVAFAGAAAASFYVKKTTNDSHAGFLAFGALMLLYAGLVAFSYWFFRMKARRNLVLLTNGGSHIVFTNVRKWFALEVTRVIQNVMTGRESRRIHVNLRRRRITFIETA